MLDSLLQPDRASGQGMVFAYAVNMVLHRLCTDCLGIVGEYVGKTYMEAKERPRFIIQDEI